MSTAMLSMDQTLSPEKELIKQVQCLLWHAAERIIPKERFTETIRILNSWPAATDAFGLALNRLNNAQRYMATREWAAARYELRLLEKQLQSDCGGQRPISGPNFHQAT